MKRQDPQQAIETPMWNDPNEPAYVRELLSAGRNEGNTFNYDVSAGLAKHMANVQAGAPLPHWAKLGAGGGAGVGAWTTWLVLPIVAATAATGIWFATRDDSAAVKPVQHAPVAVRPIEAAPQREPIAAEPSAPAAQLVAPSEAPVHIAPANSTLKPARNAHAAVKPSAATSSAAKLAPELPATKTSTGNAPGATPDSASASATLDRLMSAKQPAAQAAEPVAAAPREAQNAHDDQAEAPAKPAAQVEKQASESQLEREMQMLAVAQRVLLQDPARALRLAEQGEREFPRTMFSAERRQLALLAMVKLGRLDEARRIGQPFLAQYPNAPWSARLKRALATGRVE